MASSMGMACTSASARRSAVSGSSQPAMIDQRSRYGQAQMFSGSNTYTSPRSARSATVDHNRSGLVVVARQKPGAPMTRCQAMRQVLPDPVGPSTSAPSRN
ncbi:hypothetical protein [Tomitella cavernea]|uniref:hypothetical protein n=1 Tax=Tomitella cavernea TaxID=1387982 RepID=UPI003CD084DF